MLKVENIEIFGWDAAIRGMRNPMNSWDKSDTPDDADLYIICGSEILVPPIGPNDLALMKKLVKAGSDHSKFMRMINVTMDITAPLYWWKEYDTYKVGTVANSCSTMHKIHAKEFGLGDFSWEHLSERALTTLERIIDDLNYYRDLFVETKEKKYWWQIIQLLPSSYEQTRTVQLNYAVLQNIYPARRNHKLDEWHTLCDVIEHLPYSELITGEEHSNE